MPVLVIGKSDEDQTKNKFKTFFKRSRASNSKVTGQIWSDYELVRDFMPVLVTRKFDDDPIKNEDTIVFTTCSPL